MVKEVMERLRVTIISILSGLSFLVSGQGLLISCANCDIATSGEVTCALERGNSYSHALFAPDSLPRHAVSRIGKPSGKGNIPSAQVVYLPALLELRSLKSCSPVERSLALAKAWQFECRTAPIPRAPAYTS